MTHIQSLGLPARSLHGLPDSLGNYRHRGSEVGAGNGDFDGGAGRAGCGPGGRFGGHDGIGPDARLVGKGPQDGGVLHLGLFVNEQAFLLEAGVLDQGIDLHLRAVRVVNERLTDRARALIGGVNQQGFQECDGVHYGLLGSRSWSSLLLIRRSCSRISCVCVSTTAMRSPSRCTLEMVCPAAESTMVVSRPTIHQSALALPLPLIGCASVVMEWLLNTTLTLC